MKGLLLLAIYITILHAGFWWLTNEDKEEIVSLQHSLSNQIAIHGDCVDENDFFTE
jgi:hypothetical protein